MTSTQIIQSPKFMRLTQSLSKWKMRTSRGYQIWRTISNNRLKTWAQVNFQVRQSTQELIYNKVGIK